MQPPKANRRTFLLQSAATVAAASTVNIATNAFAGGSDTLKIGLVGCGGRGTGAAMQALKADPGNHLVAMGDAFADQVDSSLSTLKGSAVGSRATTDCGRSSSTWGTRPSAACGSASADRRSATR